MQAIKFDRVVVARRMQHHAVRRRPCLFVADIGVARETDVMVDGSPPVGAVPDEFAAGLRSAPRLRGSAVVSWPVRMIARQAAPGDEQRHQDRCELGDDGRRGEAGPWRR